MNFLAHAYLSFGQEEILVGNFIADFVRGKDLQKYPKNVQLGIHLHRAIDTYTDSNHLVKQVQSFLIPRFGHYSRVISDVFFDYYLAKNWTSFSTLPLEHFSLDTYRILSSFSQELPESFLQVFHWMQTHNWLYAYRQPTGIQAALDGLSRRARFDSKMNEATEVLYEKEEEIEALFFAFFANLETFASTTLAELTSSHDPS